MSKKKCAGTRFEEIPISPVKQHLTGSSYEGDFDVMGMSGFGEYTFDNGVVYRGQFKDGMFHGIGELIYNEGPVAESVIRGRWVKGALTEKKLVFNGTLEYVEKAWQYCKLPDRRYGAEQNTDLQPAGKSFLTPDVPTREIPFGCYDTGDGFYDPETRAIYNYDRRSVILRAPSQKAQKWIQDNCRTEPLRTVGPRPDFYNPWSTPELELTPPPNRMKYKNPSLFDHAYEDEKCRYGFYDPNTRVDLQRPPERKFQPNPKDNASGYWA